MAVGIVGLDALHALLVELIEFFHAFIFVGIVLLAQCFEVRVFIKRFFFFGLEIDPASLVPVLPAAASWMRPT